MRDACGDPSAVVLESTGDAWAGGGDCGLCDGVEGTERAFTEVGEILEAEWLATRAVGPSVFDIFEGVGVWLWLFTEDSSFSAAMSGDIECSESNRILGLMHDCPDS